MATLWLVGMMGAGKSSVARLVAAQVGVEVYDTDDEVTRRSGRSIDEWFADDRDGFRSAERAVVEALAGGKCVVACGGGVVLDPETVDVMRESGTVIWLEAPTPLLAERVGSGAGRPLLGDDPARELSRILDQRTGVYTAAAHETVDASQPLDQVVEEVIALWGNSG